ALRLCSNSWPKSSSSDDGSSFASIMQTMPPPGKWRQSGGRRLRWAYSSRNAFSRAFTVTYGGGHAGHDIFRGTPRAIADHGARRAAQRRHRATRTSGVPRLDLGPNALLVDLETARAQLAGTAPGPLAHVRREEELHFRVGKDHAAHVPALGD